MKKILYLDTETTGLTEKSAVVQISGIIEIDGVEKEEFNFYIAPHPDAIINDEALKIQGRTLEEIQNFESPAEIFQKLLEIFDKYINKFDKEDKFIIAGYNVDFDIKMLNSFFKRNGSNYFFSYIGIKLDPLYLLSYFYLKGKLELKQKNKLEDWCEYFGIEINAHDSLEDIRATQKLIKKLMEF
ncbi:MAG: 3'-5' exonuclease [Fusobacteriaceae bacterium]